MKFGTMSILFREQLGTDEHIGYTESLTRIKAAGFSVADLNLCQICAHKTTLHRDDWQSETEKIANTAASLGIELAQCHLPFKSNKVKWKTPEEYSYYIDMFYRAIDVASMLQIPWAVVHPEVRSELGESEQVAANHAEFDRLVEYALSKGLGIAFENMQRGHWGKAENLVELIDSFRDDRVGACWDTGHANIYYQEGEQWDPLHVVGHRLHCTHIADNRGETDLHLLPWEAHVNWPNVIAALKDIQYSGALILEPSVNYWSPNCLKDENGRHAYEVARTLSEL